MSNAATGNDVQVAEAMLTIVNGDEAPFTSPLFLRVHNGQDVPMQTFNSDKPNVLVKVPFHNGVGDLYAISASAPGYRDSGCFFPANPKILAEPKLLLLREHPVPQFTPWETLKTAHPKVATFLSIGQSDSEAQGHYEDLRVNKPNSLACLLNLTQAMIEIDLDGLTPLSYFKEICWDNTLAQDRFFGYVDPSIIPVIRAAASRGEFAEEKNCGEFHPGSTCSWKQIAFPVTNVQLTFHEHDTKVIGGLTCVRIEPDIDLYRELLAHGFGEVFPNLLTGGLTNPYDVFSMRWTTASTITAFHSVPDTTWPKEMK